MTKMPADTSFKRRRVVQACDRCRAIKSKCDGRHPVCSRCEGYGYDCLWGEQRDRVSASAADVSTARYETMQRTLRYYDRLLASLRPALSGADRARVDNEMAQARSSLPSDVFDVGSAPVDEYARTGAMNGAVETADSPRLPYLGKASELSYFNELKAHLSDAIGNGSSGPGPNSYGIVEDDFAVVAPWSESMLPDRERVDQLMDVYFSTIHVAYPHICRPRFLGEYKKFWDQHAGARQSSNAWYAKFITILALGAYYSSLCPQKIHWLQPDLHVRLFSHATASAQKVESENSLDRVQLLLLQSFYMLATSHVDRCWLTLGTAIRIAQGAGLHVCDAHDLQVKATSKINQEKRRRLWYSLFILDHLLSLQLGRPFAIDANDCVVQAPSLCDDRQFDVDEDFIPEPAAGPQTVDYFHNVINLSNIINRVVRQLYGAQALQSTSAKLDAIHLLDVEIVRWRAQLPRSLRFDLGHTFEKQGVFKRQRNMLAVKFHHLRALIHRPFLGYLSLHGVIDPSMTVITDVDWNRMKISEMTCIAEARQTAHLLHNLPDEESLVHEFPWWQMISCLTCACSILLIAQKVMDNSSISTHTTVDMLAEDATTCIRVLEVLSANSKPALLAMKMMQGLQKAVEGTTSWLPHCVATAITLTGINNITEPAQNAFFDGGSGLTNEELSLLLLPETTTPSDTLTDPQQCASMVFDTTDVFPWSQHLLYLSKDNPITRGTEPPTSHLG